MPLAHGDVTNEIARIETTAVLVGGDRLDPSRILAIDSALLLGIALSTRSVLLSLGGRDGGNSSQRIGSISFACSVAESIHCANAAER